MCVGLRNEGLFRVNGNARVVEALRAQFDETGDADLCDVDDVMAVAGLLKLYLRELPQPLIPEKDTQLFLAIQIGRVQETLTDFLKYWGGSGYFI